MAWGTFFAENSIDYVTRIKRFYRHLLSRSAKMTRMATLRSPDKGRIHTCEWWGMHIGLSIFKICIHFMRRYINPSTKNQNFLRICYGCRRNDTFLRRPIFLWLWFNLWTIKKSVGAKISSSRLHRIVRCRSNDRRSHDRNCGAGASGRVNIVSILNCDSWA
jgi:hypothetical protein